ALQVIRYARVCLFFEPRSDPVSEAGRMIRLDSGIFVHMKKLDCLPIEVLLDQRVRHRNLRVAGGGDHARPALLSDRTPDEAASVYGGGPARHSGGVVDTDMSIFIPKLRQRFNRICCHMLKKRFSLLRNITCSRYSSY